MFLSGGSFPDFGGCPAPLRSERCCSPPIPLLHGGRFPGAPGHRSRLGQAHGGSFWTPRDAAPTSRPAPQSRGLCFEGGGGQGHVNTEYHPAPRAGSRLAETSTGRHPWKSSNLGTTKGRFCNDEIIDLGGAGEVGRTSQVRGASGRGCSCWAGPAGPRVSGAPWLGPGLGGGEGRRVSEALTWHWLAYPSHPSRAPGLGMQASRPAQLLLNPKQGAWLALGALPFPLRDITPRPST